MCGVECDVGIVWGLCGDCVGLKGLKGLVLRTQFCNSKK